MARFGGKYFLFPAILGSTVLGYLVLFFVQRRFTEELVRSLHKVDK
jgi:hypothetical protein